MEINIFDGDRGSYKKKLENATGIFLISNLQNLK